MKLRLFWAPFAEPSVRLKERLTGHNRIEIEFVDVVEDPETAYHANITALPTLCLLEDGVELRRRIGYDPDETLDFMED